MKKLEYTEPQADDPKTWRHDDPDCPNTGSIAPDQCSCNPPVKPGKLKPEDYLDW